MLLQNRKFTKYKIESPDHMRGIILDIYINDASWDVTFILIKFGKPSAKKSSLIPVYNLGSPDQIKKIQPVEIYLKNKSVPKWDYNNEVTLTNFEQFIPEFPSMTKFKDYGKHCRSGREIKDFKIIAPDGNVGQVDDFLIEIQFWKLRYFLVDLKNYNSTEKMVLFSPHNIEKIIWNKKEIHTDLSKELIWSSPGIFPDRIVNKKLELEILKYYRSKMG